MTVSIKCGRCHGTHDSVDGVRACYVSEPAPTVVIVPGIYVTPEGKKYRVRRSVETGHLYAEDIQVKKWFYRKWHSERHWAYALGAITKLTPEMLVPDADFTTGRLPS